jgi:hypothetical protein
MMGLYVEVHCDALKDGREPGNILLSRCWSHRGDNPQGHNVRTAREEARRQGWKLGRGNAAICPGCLSDHSPETAPNRRLR